MSEPAELPRGCAKIVIADPSWLVRDGLARLLSELVPECNIQTAADGIVLHNLLRTNPDLTLVLVGKVLVGDEEEPLFRHIHKLAADAAIAITGDVFSQESVRKAVYYGALGVVCTSEAREKVSAALAKLLASEVAMPVPPSPIKQQAAAPNSASDIAVLTPRERDVFALLGKGLSVLLIAENLQLSPHTVRVHTARIMKKLDLRDRSALMHRAVSRTAPPSAERFNHALRG